MIRMKPVFAALLALGISACAATPPPATIAAAPAEQRAPVTILVSIDGFRADYLTRGITPQLSALAAGGVSAAMRPSFPSKTFPNHWAIVTGLRPDRSGIVSNNMEDPTGKRKAFTMATDDPWWWNAASPIWVDAEKAGIRTATMFWPGSSVAIGGTRADAWPNDITGGTRPEDWWPYGMAVTGPQRVAGVLDWLRRPAAIRPKLVTLYFDTVDTAGHRYGPDDPHTDAAITDVDTSIGLLVDGLAALHQPANLIILADHGMAATSSDRVVLASDLADPADYRLVESGVFATFAPVPGHETKLAAELARPRAHVQCWPKDRIPARFHYGTNPRIPPFFCLADVGWHIEAEAPKQAETGGDHGYDNDAPEMRALFVANGPAFAAGRTIPTFDNVDVEPLLRDLLGLRPVSDIDGTDAPFRGVLAAH